MFAVIYRGYCKEGREADYRTAWLSVVDYFKQHYGALGSVLSVTEDGEYIAYSLWPDKESRDAAWGDHRQVIIAEIEQAILTLKACLDPTKPQDELHMTVLENRSLFNDIRDNYSNCEASSRATSRLAEDPARSALNGRDLDKTRNDNEIVRKPDDYENRLKEEK